MSEDDLQPAHPLQQPSSTQALLTPELLEIKLKALAQQLTRDIGQEAGKISRELRGEIDKLGERTATLETKFDETIHYLQALEEENVSSRKIWKTERDVKTSGSMDCPKKCPTTISAHSSWVS